MLLSLLLLLLSLFLVPDPLAGVYSLIDWVDFQKIVTPKANGVNLGHTSFLGVLKQICCMPISKMADNTSKFRNPRWPPTPG